MTRYIATITVRVAFDAGDAVEASTVAADLADTITVPAPRGRSAEILTVASLAVASRVKEEEVAS